MGDTQDPVQCSICKKKVNRICSCIVCSICHQWAHMTCNNITRNDISKSDYLTFECMICKEAKNLLRFKEMKKKKAKTKKERVVLVDVNLNKENDIFDDSANEKVKSDLFIEFQKCEENSNAMSDCDLKRSVDIKSNDIIGELLQCSICKKKVNRICSCITCSICHQWAHFTCNNITRNDLSKSDYKTFECLICKEARELQRFKEIKRREAKMKKEREVLIDLHLNKENDLIDTSTYEKEVFSDDSDFEEFQDYEEFSNAVSDFELKRLENIKRNKEIFDSFEIFQAKEEVALPPKKSKLSNIKKEKKEEQHNLPHRSSLRIQKKQSDSSAMFSENIIQYKERMDLLKIEKIAQVTKTAGHSLTWHPSESKRVVCCGDEKGFIGIWDVDCMNETNSVSLIEVHTKTVSSLICPTFDQSKLYSCSYDGTFGCGDINMLNFKPQFKANFFEKFHHCAIPYQQRNSILLTSGVGDLLMLDLSSYEIANKFQLCYGSKQPAKSVDCHPTNEFLIATTSANGTVAIWDLRSIKRNNDSKDKCLSSIEASEAVVKTFFSPITGKQILMSSRDGSLNVFDVDGCGMIQLPVRHQIKLGTYYGTWPTTFCATWDPKTEHSFVCSGNSFSKSISLFTCDEMENNMLAYTLTNDKFIYKTSLNLFHPHQDMIGCATFTGRVLIWS